MNDQDKEPRVELVSALGYEDFDDMEVDEQRVINDILPVVKSREERLVRESVALVAKKFQKLEHGIFAIKPFLDKPYPDDPRWTPYTRFIQPREIMVRKALENVDVGELWAMGEMQRQASLTKSQEKKL